LRKFEFNTSAHRFRVEAWKGNYWNLGAGAEIGFYYDPNESISGDFWKCGYGAYQFKMTLSLLHIPTGTTLYSRSPAETHWWITGFSPRWQDTKVQDLRLTGSVSFSGHPEGNEIYAAFKAKYKTEIGLLEFNDATLTVHIVW
jgi:hypothetical protein